MLKNDRDKDQWYQFGIWSGFTLGERDEENPVTFSFIITFSTLKDYIEVTTIPPTTRLEQVDRLMCDMFWCHWESVGVDEPYVSN